MASAYPSPSDPIQACISKRPHDTHSWTPTALPFSYRRCPGLQANVLGVTSWRPIVEKALADLDAYFEEADELAHLGPLAVRADLRKALEESR